MPKRTKCVANNNRKGKKASFASCGEKHSKLVLCFLLRRIPHALHEP